MIIYASVLKKFLFAVAVSVIAAGMAQAQILYIDDSNPAMVTITVGASTPSQTVSGPINQGIDLLQFFGGNVGAFPNLDVVSSTLTNGPSGTGPLITQASGDDVTLNPADSDLNLYHNSDSDQLSFAIGTQPFSGTLVLNLSMAPYVSNLPAVGSLGTVILGYSGNQGPIIGQWEVVSAPEPSAWMLVLISFACLPLLRRFSRS